MDLFASMRRQDLDCGCDLGLYIDDSTNFNLTQRYIVVTILGVSIYNCAELIPIILATFTRYNGLYFWSLVVSILGILMSNVSNLVSNFYPNPPRLQVGFIGLFGWAFMVTGQSLVLYSRLDLLPLGNTTRRWVLRVIIFNAVVMQVPIIVLNTGAKSSKSERFLPAFMIYERIQIIVFFLQEMALSCVYVWECFRFLILPGKSRTWMVRRGLEVMNRISGHILHPFPVRLLTVSRHTGLRIWRVRERHSEEFKASAPPSPRCQRSCYCLGHNCYRTGVLRLPYHSGQLQGAGI